MTAIAYRDGVMAADSVGWTANNSQIKVPVAPKIVRLKDGGLIACAGDTLDITEWHEHMRDGKTIPSFDKDDGFTCLWVSPCGTIRYCDYRQRWIMHHSTFVAVGAAETFLWGALHAGATAEEAVRLAIRHTDGAGGEVQVERLHQSDHDVVDYSSLNVRAVIRG